VGDSSRPGRTGSSFSWIVLSEFMIRRAKVSLVVIDKPQAVGADMKLKDDELPLNLHGPYEDGSLAGVKKDDTARRFSPPRLAPRRACRCV
jgi:hypothetical protein